jgi:hypothetical protein
LIDPFGVKTPLFRSQFGKVLDYLGNSLIFAIFPLEKFAAEYKEKYGDKISKATLNKIIDSSATRLTAFFTFYTKKMYFK